MCKMWGSYHMFNLARFDHMSIVPESSPDRWNPGSLIYITGSDLTTIPNIFTVVPHLAHIIHYQTLYNIDPQKVIYVSKSSSSSNS